MPSKQEIADTVHNTRGGVNIYEDNLKEYYYGNAARNHRDKVIDRDVDLDSAFERVHDHNYESKEGIATKAGYKRKIPQNKLPGYMENLTRRRLKP
jgi:hypothetical protein